jgi:hypothetical protein
MQRLHDSNDGFAFEIVRPITDTMSNRWTQKGSTFTDLQA